jgi:hypothetical protein
MAKKDKDEPKTFTSLLDTPMSQISRPKPAPHGSYLGMVKGLPRYDKSTKKGTPFSEYTIQLLEAQDDVDEDALKEWLTKGDGAVVPLREKSMRLTFYHTPDALWRLEKFLKDLGLEAEDEDQSIGDVEQMSPGRQVLVHVKHSPSDDGETMFANIDKTGPAD